MFSYYGSKSKLVHLYPKPKHDKIIEPFAGSAQYSLLHWYRDVELYDLSEYVIKVWEYLLQATKEDVLSLPVIPSKVSLNTIEGLTDAERYLIGFHLCRGKAKPRHTGHGQNSWANDRIRIANSLYKIRHWKVYQETWGQIQNETATWFIDPPYQAVNGKSNGDRYPHSVIDYNNLADWIKERRGQVIACEGEADYLPFQLLTFANANTNNSGVNSKIESVYYQ